MVIRSFTTRVRALRFLAEGIISPDKTVIQEINRDTRELVDLTFGDPELEALLTDLEVVFDLEVLKTDGAEGRTVEYPLSVRYSWAGSASAAKEQLQAMLQMLKRQSPTAEFNRNSMRGSPRSAGCTRTAAATHPLC